jgi:hypothetical protein
LIAGIAGCTFTQPASFPTDRFPGAPFYEDVERGEFLAIVTDAAGHVVRLRGRAEFVDESYGGVAPFRLELRDTEIDLAVMMRGPDFRPDLGSYPIEPELDDGITLSARLFDATPRPIPRAQHTDRRYPNYRAYVGSLQVEAATEERLAGAFAFEATGWGLSVGLGPVVYVEGWFDATDGYNAR